MATSASANLLSRLKNQGEANTALNKITDEALGTQDQKTGAAIKPTQDGINPNKDAEPLAPPNPNQTQPLNVQQRAADPAQDVFMNQDRVAANKGIDGQELDQTISDPSASVDFTALASSAPAGGHSIVGEEVDNGQVAGMQGSYTPTFVRAGYGQSVYEEPTADDLKNFPKGQFLAGSMKRWIAPNGDVIPAVDGVFLPVEGDSWTENDMIKDLRVIAKRKDGSLFEGTGSDK